MRISKITIDDIKNYLHVYHSEDDKLIEAILVASKAFVRNYTGLQPEQLDISEDLSMAVFILSSELYDNRVYTVENTNINPAIQAILNMHSVNLL
jgi:N12 class adenine-specific DNA methylase